MFGKRRTVIQHPVAHQLYNYVLGRRFDPGAQAEAFQPKFSNPVFLFRGPGRVAGGLRVFQHPQVWFRQQVTVSGLGGIVNGQLVGQPLLDPAQFESA